MGSLGRPSDRAKQSRLAAKSGIKPIAKPANSESSPKTERSKRGFATGATVMIIAKETSVGIFALLANQKEQR